ncbi:hypothetical protein PG22506_1229 [Bifidobacterium pseudolongum subsp. globosum]|nr:hypothetical protein PG22506_1229 [Bifidobacterium pseudolongum subsp. globosum]
MRGKRGRVHRTRLNRRIIPAHAGQTGNRSGVSGGATDHPRACGANERVGVVDRGTGGSSPRMRGKQKARQALTAKSRIIPAHAGQTPSAGRTTTRRADHPRACGANSLIPLAKRTPTILEKFDLHSRSHFANVIMVPNFLTSARNPQFNIAATTIYQNDDIAMHCSNLFYEMRPEISRWIRLDHEAS